MSDIRLKERRYTFDGRDVILRCNMNVLADVQEAYGGNIAPAIRGGTVKSVLHFLTAMLNDYMDDIGETKRYTVREVGRLVPPSSKKIEEITSIVLPLVTAALNDADDDENEKNALTATEPTSP